MNCCRRPPKIITRVIVFLLLGAIVNVAVAWGCSLWSAQDQWDVDRAIDVPEWPKYLQRLQWPAPNAASERVGLDGLGVTVHEVSGGDQTATWKHTGPNIEKIWVTLEVRRYGVPFRALQWESHGVRAGPRGMKLVTEAAMAAGWRAGIDASKLLGAPIRGYIPSLPLTPIWPGFAINTIFYAAILLVLFFAPGSVRRAFRRRRGLCPACAYPVGTSPVCTECGEAVTHRSLGTV